MRFILKALFWFGFVVLFLPANEPPSDRPTPPKAIANTLSPDDAQAVGKAVRAFCARHPETCKAGPREIMRLHDDATAHGDAIAQFIRSEADASMTDRK